MLYVRRAAAAGVCAVALLSAPVRAQDAPRNGIDLTAMDTSVRPGDDFFRFVNGAWLRTAEIPADESAWGGFTILRKSTRTRLRTLLDEAAANPGAKGSLSQRVGDFYASALDTAAMNARGYAPLRPYLQRLDAVRTTPELIRFSGQNGAWVGGTILAVGVGPDAKRPGVNALRLGQGGLGLPDVPYYTRNDASTSALRMAYRRYLVRLLTLTGESRPQAELDATNQIALETTLARFQKDRTQLRDVVANYNKRSVAHVDRMHPHLMLGAYLRAAGLQADSIIVTNPAYLGKLDSLLAAIPARTWKNHLKLGTLRQWAPALSGDFRSAAFAYSGKALQGLSQRPERWDEAVSTVDGTMGELLGQLYVDRYFPAADKQRMEALVQDLKSAFRTRIEHLDWMSAPTKAQALQKLDALRVMVGYPDAWKQYEGVNIDRNDYFGNVMAIRQYGVREGQRRLHEPVDMKEWGMTPPTVNAYANPSMTVIVFPAGILQWPFFDGRADDAFNYGAIGAVIGHEMTHHFDDQGRRFDATGRLRDWWTPEDARQFEARTQRVVDQYSAATVLDSLHLNGRLTLGENTADFGGLAIAYDAFKRTEEGRTNPTIDGYTADQRFMMAFAQMWRTKFRDNALRLQVQTNPHAPGEFRALVPLSNFDPFYQAFNVQPGQKMYRADADRARVW